MTELTYERFRDHIVDQLQLAGPEADPDLSFTADLGFDSLRMLELFLVLDEMGLDPLAPDSPLMQATVGDSVDDLTLRRIWQLVADRRDTDGIGAGRRVQMRPFGANDIPFVVELLGSSEENRLGWLNTTSDANFRPSLLAEAMTDFVVLGDDGSPIGFATARSEPPRSVDIGVFLVPSHRSAGIGIEVGILLLDHVFSELDVERIFCSTYEPGLAAVRSGIGRLFEVSAVLRERRFFGGRFWDEHVLTIDRATWRERSEPFAGLFRRHGRSVASRWDVT